MAEMAYLDTEKLREDMAAYGVSAKQLSLALGKAENYITVLLARRYTGKKNILRIERQMFKPDGTYTLPAEKTPAQIKTEAAEERLAKLETSIQELIAVQAELLKEIIETQRQTNTQIMKLRSLTERVWDKG